MQGSILSFFSFGGNTDLNTAAPPNGIKDKKKKKKKKKKVLSYHNPGWLAFQTTLNILEGQMRER